MLRTRRRGLCADPWARDRPADRRRAGGDDPVSGGGGFGISRFSYESTGSLITPYENSETRFTYSLGFGAGLSLAERFWLSTGFGFSDYINKDHDEIFDWGIGVACLITDNFYVSLGYFRRLNYVTQESVDLSTGYRW